MKWLGLLYFVGLASATAAILGIDYGTEFIKSSLVAPNAPFEIVLTADSQRKDASGLVIKPPNGERIYGSSGVSFLSKFPDSSLYAIKPLLGVPFDDLRVGLFEETHPGLKLVRTPRNTVAFNVSGTVIPVEEVVAMQINDVKERATAMVRERTHSKNARLEDVVISVPGNFGSAQRQALIDSVGLADAQLVGLVSDGIAVAINYANSPAISSKLGAQKHYVAVYDAGASVTTSTLVSLKLDPSNSGVVDVQVEGFGSNLAVCGRALTAVMREILIDRFFKSYKPVDRTPRLLNRLWREAERAKHVLSANTDVYVHIESLFDDADLSTRVTREDFEKAADIAGEVVSPLKDSLGELTYDDIDAVVLAGGASRTPFVLEQLKSEVGDAKLSRNVNADEANVQGTCMRGIGMSGLFRTKRTFNVVDASTHHYEAHIKTTDGGSPEILELFTVGTPLGSTASISIPQNIVQLEVYEDRKPLATWELPYARANIDSLFEPGAYSCVDDPVLEARFVLNPSAVLQLSAVEAACNSTVSSSTTLADALTTRLEVSATRGTEETDVAGTTSSSTSDAPADGSAESQTTSVSSTSLGGASAEQTASSVASTSSDNTRPKVRRLSTRVNWVQEPVGSTERAAIRAHLRKMDKSDEDRKQFGVLHHELESLAYRVRQMVDEGRAELAHLSNRLLSWIDEGSTSLSELHAHLRDARGVFEEKTTTRSDAASSDATSETTRAGQPEASEVAHDEL